MAVHIVDVADMKVSAVKGDVLVTHALGSCLGIAIHDPAAHVGGLLHVMLPLSTIDPKRGKENPYMFVDTGVPKLFLECYKAGARKERLHVKVAGGACTRCDEEDDYFQIGKRNFIMLKKLFWKNGVLEKVVPRIDGYSNTHANGLSTNDTVICTSLRHAQGSVVRGASLAFVWKPRSDEVIRLPLLEGYQASYAYSISHDGTSVSGFQTKAGKGNVPVVWTKNTAGKWRCAKLPTIYDDNPLLATAGVRISPSGRQIVAPITADMVASALFPYVSETHMWTRSEDGSWNRQLRSESGLRVRAINDHGTFVGRHTQMIDGTPHSHAYVCTMEKGLQVVGVLHGDVESEALDINNSGIVVGWSTDPYGATDPEKDLGYDDPFVWTATGGMRKIIIASTPSTGAHGSATTITDGNRIGGRVTIVDELNEPAFTAVLK